MPASATSIEMCEPNVLLKLNVDQKITDDNWIEVSLRHQVN